MPKGEITSEIIKEIGVLSTSKSGWNREVNLVSWNKGTPKIDIRDWAPDHEKAGKGVSQCRRGCCSQGTLTEYDPYSTEA